MRRNPKQERSQQSLQIIFQAAEKLLSKYGLSQFTTRKLAEVSGFSVGLIYQYFSNKDAVLKAMALACNNKIIDSIENDAAKINSDSNLSDSVRDVVASIVRNYSGVRPWEKILLRIGWEMDQDPEFIETTSRIGRVLFILIEKLHKQGRCLEAKLVDEKLFFLTKAISGVIRSFVLEERDLNESAYLIDQLQYISLAVMCNNNEMACKCPACVES